MRERQKIFLVSAVVILAVIVLIEGVVILRNSFTLTHRNESLCRDLTAPFFKTFSSPVPPKNDHLITGEMKTEDIVLQETAEDLEHMQNQINRLFYEMTRAASFTPQNIGRQERHERQNPFTTMRSSALSGSARAESLRYDLPSPTEAGLREGGNTSQPPDSIRRLQAEIAHIFQIAHASRHNNALRLIDQDWDNVGEISSMNMEEDDTNYVVTISMPGFERTDINVGLNGRVLTVEASAEHQRAAQDYRTARSGRFKTRIMLPDDITGESARAFYRDGTLKIMVPKKPAGNSLARKIKIM